MAKQHSRIRVIVFPPGGKVVVAVDSETGRLLFLTRVFTEGVSPGEYMDPESIVEVFRVIATRNHETKGVYNPQLLYKGLEALLLADLPVNEKTEQVLRFIRAFVRSSTG